MRCHYRNAAELTRQAARPWRPLSKTSLKTNRPGNYQPPPAAKCARSPLQFTPLIKSTNLHYVSSSTVHNHDTRNYFFRDCERNDVEHASSYCPKYMKTSPGRCQAFKMWMLSAMMSFYSYFYDCALNRPWGANHLVWIDRDYANFRWPGDACHASVSIAVYFANGGTYVTWKYALMKKLALSQK